VHLSLRLFAKIRAAYERQRDLVEILDAHTTKLTDLQKLIRLLEDENALHTANLQGPIDDLKHVQQDLNVCLRALNPAAAAGARRNTVVQTSQQLFKGSRDEKMLADIMVRIEDAKRNVCFTIQVASVGFYRIVGEKIVVIAEVVQRIDKMLVELLGEGSGLKMAELLQKHPSDGLSCFPANAEQSLVSSSNPELEEGLVILSKAEVASLRVEGPSAPSDISEAPTRPLDQERIERIIIGNMALDDAVQFNGPIGEDIWKNITVRIENNRATGTAVQVNYITREQDFQAIQAERQARIEERRLSREAQERKEIRELEERKTEREREDRKLMREAEERMRKTRS
jgi:hypothetical protein